jgi:hypothetical protein
MVGGGFQVAADGSAGAGASIALARGAILELRIRIGNPASRSQSATRSRALVTAIAGFTRPYGAADRESGVTLHRPSLGWGKQ